MSSLERIRDIFESEQGFTQLPASFGFAAQEVEDEFTEFPIENFSTVVPQASASASALFDFDVSVFNASVDAMFDGFIEDIAAVTAAALDLWAEFIVGAAGANIDVAVTIADLPPGTVASATAGDFFLGLEDENGFVEVFTSAQLELILGADFNGDDPDIIITVNSGFLEGASFDTDPNRTAIPGVIDFVSVLAHEINHSLGFLSFRDNSGEDFQFDIDGDGDLETLDSTYGSFVEFADNGDPFLTATFNGANTVGVYGEPVILETTTGSPGSDVSHFAAFLPDGTFAPTVLALENPFVIPGDIVSVGTLELAVLADLGFNIDAPIDLPLTNELDAFIGAEPIITVNSEITVIDGQPTLVVERTSPFLVAPTSVGVGITGNDGVERTLRVVFDTLATTAFVPLDPEIFFDTSGDAGDLQASGDVSVRLFFPTQGSLANGTTQEVSSASLDEVTLGSAGDDRIVASNGDDSVFAAGGDDTVIGLNGDDALSGDGGDDRLIGNNGDDTINGGDGEDVIISGNGDDVNTGGDGDDRITAGNGDDFIDGGDGDDNLIAGNGDDFVFGGAGDDNVVGNAGADTLVGNEGNDTLIGGGGDDIISGGDDDDRIIASSGNDDITGGSGNDEIFGGSGNDTIDGGAGSDEINVGSGSNTVVFTFGTQDDADTVISFNDNTDQLVFDGFDFDSVEDVIASAEQVFSNVLITLDEATNQTVLIRGVRVSELNDGNIEVIGSADDDDGAVVALTASTTAALSVSDEIFGTDPTQLFIGDDFLF